MEFPMHIVAVGGLVRNGRDEILLVKDPRRGWEFPGGQVELGESLIQALQREVLEESGVHVQVNDMVGIYSNVAGAPGYNGVEYIPPIVNIDFLCEWISGEPVPGSETLEAGWFTPEDALNMVTLDKIAFRFRNMVGFSGCVRYAAFRTQPFEILDQYAFRR